MPQTPTAVHSTAPTISGRTPPIQAHEAYPYYEHAHALTRESHEMSKLIFPCPPLCHATPWPRNGPTDI
eukprot:XP_001701752.1 predicted protein [Chlamydomonas reinhardtii]